MSISRIISWNEGDTLTAVDLNAEFNNIITAGINLVSPLSAGQSMDLNGLSLTLDDDGDSTIAMATDDLLKLVVGGVLLWQWDGTTASSINGLTFGSGATTVAPTITARSTSGGETNIDINLVPLGTGQVQQGGVDLTNVGTLHHSIQFYGS